MYFLFGHCSVGGASKYVIWRRGMFQRRLSPRRTSLHQFLSEAPKRLRNGGIAQSADQLGQRQATISACKIQGQVVALVLYPPPELLRSEHDPPP